MTIEFEEKKKTFYHILVRKGEVDKLDLISIPLNFYDVADLIQN